MTPSELADAVEGLAKALDYTDRVRKACPVNNPRFDSSNECPKCGRSSSESCGPLDAANYACVAVLAVAMPLIRAKASGEGA